MKITEVALAVALVLGVPGSAQAWGWLTTPDPASDAVSIEDPLPAEPLPEGGALPVLAEDGACIAAILAAEQRYNIPDNLLMALGLQEAGYRTPRRLTIWPWTVNAAGEGRRFETKSEAIAFVQSRQAEGISVIDIGCLQINLRWHPDAFGTLSQGFEPSRNVDYAARFLHNLYLETGDWWQAAGHYHSRSSGPQGVYLSSLKRNHQVAQARLPQFLALAEGAGFDPADIQIFADAAVRPRREPTPYRTEGAIWGADISGEEGGRRSLYSALDLEPILPAFLPPEI